jgi:predicted methyltransferase
MGKMLVALVALLVSGCSPSPSPETPSAPADSSADRPDAVFDAMPDEIQARYPYRHPRETLEFFGIRPGMTVVEALPGGGWYSQILVPYLGEDGRLIGANYARDMWPKFGFFDQAFIDSMATWTTDWPQQAEAWRGEDGAVVEAFEFGSLPTVMEGQADAVLLIRALHNLARFENDGGYLTMALRDVHRVLKPDGIVGVVQHEARPAMPDEWANGARGYLKKQFVIDRMTAAGFEFVDGSDINENPDDQPTTEDVVWRLPPSYMSSREHPELRAAMDAIGESHRMTLKFRKSE